MFSTVTMSSIQQTEPTAEQTEPSAQDIAAKLAEITAMLTAGGTNKEMKICYTEYQKLVVELKEAKAAR